MKKNEQKNSEQSLATEMETFRCREAELREKHRDGFVVIRGNEVLGVWRDRVDALQEGVKAYGDVSFLVRDINAGRLPPVNFSRDLSFI